MAPSIPSSHFAGSYFQKAKTALLGMQVRLAAAILPQLSSTFLTFLASTLRLNQLRCCHCPHTHDRRCRRSSLPLPLRLWSTRIATLSAPGGSSSASASAPRQRRTARRLQFGWVAQRCVAARTAQCCRRVAALRWVAGSALRRRLSPYTSPSPARCSSRCPFHLRS